MKSSYQKLNIWFQFVSEVREVFSRKLQLKEVMTPLLVPSPGIEEHIQVFKVIEEGVQNPRNYSYLPTSPEFALKKLLGAGFENIFEISHSFRFEEKTALHSPEFTMLEWYRTGQLDSLISDIKTMVQVLKEKGFIKDEAPSFYETSFSQEFKSHCNFELTPSTTKEDLFALCGLLGLYCVADDSFNDLFHRIVMEKIETQWDKRQVTIVKDFPPSCAALAIINKAGWADRFEVYWKGIELGNAYNELLDSGEQSERFNETNKKRKEKGWEILPQDESLALQLKKIDKQIVGIAVGLERLFMACQGINDISELRLD